MPTTIFPVPLLSKRQAELCETIERLTAERGFSPSMREVAERMGLTHGRVAQLARSTERKGALARAPGIARGWRVLKPASPTKAASKRGR
jgi:SOS-response transcriptional repressor LexA